MDYWTIYLFVANTIFVFPRIHIADLEANICGDIHKTINQWFLIDTFLLHSAYQIAAN